MAEKDASARLRRAVKENNLFLVKRLIQRADMRNPDPGPRRYSSLAWAAVLGHEETFEYLLYAGHDDEELSKDADNNTILILLAELRPGAYNPYCSDGGHPDLMGAALRMARIYHERYPFILEWSNVQGKTALHVAALKGNEELVRMLCDLGADYDLPDNLGNTPLHYASAWGHIPVVQLLIEKGCQVAARNHEGFNASDYAYSYNTKATLEETATMQFEARKSAKRRQHAAARNQDWSDGTNSSTRLRSGSGGSRTTATSDGGDLGTSPLQSHLASSFSSASSQPNFSVSGSGSRLPLPRQSPSLSHASSFTAVSPMPSNQSGSASSLNLPPMNPASVLSPIASRVRERDADAIAEYKKRNRSGSAGTQTSDSRSTTNGISTLPTINGSSSHLPLASASSTHPLSLTNRRLRPSVSAAQLRSSPPPIPVVTTSMDLQTPRNRSGTTPTSSRPTQILSSPLEANFPAISSPLAGGRAIERRQSNRRAGTGPIGRQSDAEDYTGPPSDYAIFPEPPPDFGRQEPGPPPAASKPSARRAAFALLSKPLPSIDSQKNQREHRRGISTSELRS